MVIGWRLRSHGVELGDTMALGSRWPGGPLRVADLLAAATDTIARINPPAGVALRALHVYQVCVRIEQVQPILMRAVRTRTPDLAADVDLGVKSH